jgi:hypothetical protein
MDIHWEAVKDAEVRYIRGLLRKRDLNGITSIGIDEVSKEGPQVPDLGNRPHWPPGHLCNPLIKTEDLAKKILKAMHLPSDVPQLRPARPPRPPTGDTGRGDDWLN